MIFIARGDDFHWKKNKYFSFFLQKFHQLFLKYYSMEHKTPSEYSVFCPDTSSLFILLIVWGKINDFLYSEKHQLRVGNGISNFRIAGTIVESKQSQFFGWLFAPKIFLG